MNTHALSCARLLGVLVTTALMLLPVTLPNAPTAAAATLATTCHFYASAAGNDGNVGSEGAPFATIGHLASKLAPGQTGCALGPDPLVSLPGMGIISKSGTAAAPITIRSAGATRAQLAGIFLVSGSNVVITDLDFVGVRGPR